jgi:hypothetical protein
VKLAQGESLQLPGKLQHDPTLDVSTGEIFPTAYAEPISSYHDNDGYGGRGNEASSYKQIGNDYY